MVKTFIRNLAGENSKQVCEIIKAHPEWYGEIDNEMMIHCQFYGLYLEDNTLVGFFALSDWGFGVETVICYLYIFEEYRKQGLFNKIIKWVKKNRYTYKYIIIGATEQNKLANDIYSCKFRFLRYDEQENGNWYIVYEK